MSQSSEAPASPRGNGSKPKNFHVIELDWAHQFVEALTRQFHNDPLKKEADVKITVTSRRIKNQENSPPDILFRTHHYEVNISNNSQYV
jgi:hypothetical protein